MPTRNMPQNIEAEMSVLGVAFLDNKSALTKICEELYPEIYRLVYPMVCKACEGQEGREITEDLIDEIPGARLC